MVDMHAKQKDFLLEFFSMSPPLCYHLNNMSLPKFSVRSWQGDVLSFGKKWEKLRVYVSFSSGIFWFCSRGQKGGEGCHRAPDWCQGGLQWVWGKAMLCCWDLAVQLLDLRVQQHSRNRRMLVRGGLTGLRFKRINPKRSSVSDSMTLGSFCLCLEPLRRLIRKGFDQQILI